MFTSRVGSDWRWRSLRAAIGWWLAAASTLAADNIPLPRRPTDAPTGSAFASRITTLGLAEREREIVRQVEQGNVPDFWRRFAEVKVSRVIAGRRHSVSFWVAPDYLAVGSDADYLLVPVTPRTAQSVADKLNCSLPTTRMVDEIWAAARVKLQPTPIPPSPAMTTVPVFLEHNETIRQQRAGHLPAHPLGVLVSGHKKDVVVTPRLNSATGKVAIYGWHQSNGQPIQPLHLGHTETWVDYSHGARLVLRAALLDGQRTTLEAILADPMVCALLSEEGPLARPRYGGNSFAETNVTLHFEPGVRVVINSPATLDTNQPVRLVLYALPNGNTIEQTIGRRPKSGEDWRFDIQHIGAQTRWLRTRMADAQLVVAYLECEEMSWPAWRREHDPDNRRIPAIVAALRGRFTGVPLKLVLTGHSGGGSFTFGLLNGLARVPEDVERIAFLDSNYAYDAAQGHSAMLAEWLAGARDRFLCVLAYHDSVALLNGKTFVSESGGTWGRSLAMRGDLEAVFAFVHERGGHWQRSTALDGRVKFVLRENPEKTVLHTRQVELNGFIHALLAGTGWESRGYEYFGSRAYAAWVVAD